MDRLREPSTWVGIVTLGAVLGGWALTPELIADIAATAATVAGIVLVLIRER
jgi:hypothetical protein